MEPLCFKGVLGMDNNYENKKFLVDLINRSFCRPPASMIDEKKLSSLHIDEILEVFVELFNECS